MSLAGLLADLGRGTLDLLFAPVCVACGGPVSAAAAERLVCATCWSRARELPLPRCPRCFTPRPAAPSPATVLQQCATCATLPPSLRSLRSAFVHDGPVRPLVHALKYAGWRAAARPMGRRMAAMPWNLEVQEEVRVVVPVPLSAARRRERGYNQAELLASVVASERGWRCLPDALQRTRAAESQTTLHPEERRANVAGAFRVRSGEEAGVEGEHVLLVDDVWTTGATSLACCEALVRGGARAVSVATFARALPDLQR